MKKNRPYKCISIQKYESMEQTILEATACGDVLFANQEIEMDLSTPTLLLGEVAERLAAGGVQPSEQRFYTPPPPMHIITNDFV